ncbi:hypothetical protein SAY86_026097 [Trapa natans]|uniref:BHLH domain-containing protein n=1 Tax=Trapa natans TaxID=22666 RepID=A0AAN7KL26_TRANT|nr:hypothetical protein SAY86_026097 [Trapa natans]
MVMNRGVLQSSSPVQPPMMAGVNPTWWWNINGIPSPPPLPLHAPPVSLGGLSPSSIFTDHLYVPTASGASASSSPSSSYSWQDFNNPELSESCSQLLLRGLMAGEEYSGGNTLSCFQDQQQSPKVSSAMLDHQAHQENSASSYRHMYGHPNNGQGDFHLGSAAKPLSWSSIAPVPSTARSCARRMETTSARSFSKNSKLGTRNPLKDRPYEGNNNANGGAQKKARVQPSSAQSTIKVRKEKLGDRITALHQLVSPFGKTDTASVLLEAIGYIRFLQSQIEALSSPYLGYGLRNPNHHNSEEENELTSDLRSRGLCLVPSSCILQVGESNVMTGGADCWPAAPFGGGGLAFP